MKLVIKLVALLAASLTTPVSAQDAIWINATADDNVGSRLVFNLRDRIRGSYTFRPASATEFPRWNLYIVTLDPDEGTANRGARTIYSAILALETESQPAWYMTNWVGKCGARVVADCSENILAGVSSHIETFRQYIRQ